jgi:predicted nucleic acid-binding protein
MSTVFADAFYFVGLVNRADQHHAKVVAAARRLRDSIVTTEWVLAEFADALAESASRRLVAEFIRQLEQDPKVEIIQASSELFKRGLDRYDERQDKDWSLAMGTAETTNAHQSTRMHLQSSYNPRPNV